MQYFKEHKFRMSSISDKSQLIKEKDSIGNTQNQWIDTKIEIELSSIGYFSDFIDKDGNLMKKDLEYHVLTRLFSKDITEQIVGDMGIITL